MNKTDEVKSAMSMRVKNFKKKKKPHAPHGKKEGNWDIATERKLLFRQHHIGKSNN